MQRGGQGPQGARPILDRQAPLDGLARPDGEPTLPDRRRLNARWLGASVLIATCGGALMAAALRASLDAELTPSRPVFRGGRIDEVAGEPALIGRRGDRLVRHRLVASDKQAFTAPVAHQAGARETVRLQAFVRLVTSLAPGGDTDLEIPPFDPARQLAEDQGGAPSPEDGEDDSSGTTVTVTRSDLAAAPAEDDAPGLGDEDATALVEAEARLARIASPRTPSPLSLLSQALAPARAAAPEAEDRPDPFHSIDVRVVPENVTTLVKTEPAARSGATETRDVVLERGQSLAEALTRNGADAGRVQAILAALGERARAGLPEGQHLNLFIERRDRAHPADRIARVTLYGSGGIEAVAAERDRGGFVAVRPAAGPAARPAEGAEAREETGEAGDERGQGSLYTGIYEAVLRNGLAPEVAARVVGLFAFGLDMQRPVSAADRLEVLVSPSEKAGGQPELHYACLTLDGVKHRAYAFEAPEAGAVSYFSETGGSLRKFLMRMPIAEGRITSPFGTRVHPILHYARFHNGVDWANKAGTPVMATGDGTVAFAGPRGGYGNRIEIRHANGYVTAYNHLQRLAHAVQAGAPVRQGQVIAFLGSTGLSTGPHVHYEVSVNGRFLDPMTIRLPDSRGVPPALMTSFAHQVAATNALRHHDALASATPL